MRYVKVCKEHHGIRCTGTVFNVNDFKKIARSDCKPMQICRIRMFLGLLDPDLDPLVRGTDLDPSSSKNSQKSLESYCDGLAG